MDTFGSVSSSAPASSSSPSSAGSTGSSGSSISSAGPPSGGGTIIWAEHEGRTRLVLEVGSGPDARPEIFRLATEHGWELWELHEEAGSLQDLFSRLTR